MTPDDDPNPRSPDPMSDHEQPTSVYDDPDLEWYDEGEPGVGGTDGPDTLLPRQRRKLLTPVSSGLLAVVLIAAGFIGGVQVQKHQDGDSAGAGGPRGAGGGAGFAARLAQGGTASGSAGSAATAGTVANIKGSVLYVTSADGTTIRIKTDDNAKVTRNASSSVGAVHPGDTVVVQGTKAASGTVTATSITATAKGVSAFAGLSGAGAAGGVPPGFTPPGG
jgi:hypothetical protein